MTKPFILAITGMPASGKSTCADAIAKKKGVERIKLSDFIWNWLKEQGIKKTSVTGAMFGLYLHTVYKDTPIIKWTKKQVKAQKANVILLDSVRTLEEYLKFKKKYTHRFGMIAVVAGPEERKEREIARARFGQNITEKSFEMRDAEELKIGIGSVIALADEYVDANRPLKSMLASMEKAYSRLVK